MKTEIDFSTGDQEECLIHLTSTYLALNCVLGTMENSKRNMDMATSCQSVLQLHGRKVLSLSGF